MKSIAEVSYFLAFRNAFASYLQLDNSKLPALEQAEQTKIFNDTNCLNKTRADFAATITTTLNSQSVAGSQEAVATIEEAKAYDIIYIAGKNYTGTQLQQRIEYAEKHLTTRGAILFDYANPSSKDKDGASGSGSVGDAWQIVARLRCKPGAFICVLSDVAHGCAVYRPNQPSLLLATQHIKQYDEFDYLIANRALLLNLMTMEQFLLLIRFF